VDPADTKVQAKHLKDLDKIHELLRALNDRMRLAERRQFGGPKIPILVRAVSNRAAARSSKIEINSLDHAITADRQSRHSSRSSSICSRI